MVGFNCSVYGCLNTYISKRELSFFNLPKDSERQNAWLKLIGRPELMTKSDLKSYRVCSSHFESHAMSETVLRKLTKDAMPTKYLPRDKEGGMDMQSQLCLSGSGYYYAKESRLSDKMTHAKVPILSDIKINNDSAISGVAQTDRPVVKHEVKTTLASWSGTPRKREIKENQKLHYCDLPGSDDSDDEITTRFRQLVQWQMSVKNRYKDGASEKSDDALRCDSCRGTMSGIRQVCVQCEYTHCMTCEASGAHALHYMLRVPIPRPKEEVHRIVKMIQIELADIISDAQSTVDNSMEPQIIKTEIKTEPELDPLADAVPSVEQLRPSILEQTLLKIVVKKVADPPNESAAFKAVPSASSDCSTNLPTTYLVPIPGEISSKKRRSSLASQASTAKKTLITVKGGSIGSVTVKTEPLTEEELLQTQCHQEASGESGMTSPAACAKAEPRAEEESLQTHQEATDCDESSVTTNKIDGRPKDALIKALLLSEKNVKQ